MTPEKGLWRCPSCGATGNVIQFVARKEGISNKAAALQLMQRVPGVTTCAALAQEKLPDPLAHAALFSAIVAHYHETLLGRGKRGLDYLKQRGLGDLEMLAHFKAGYVDGSLKKKLSAAQIAAAQACGLFNERGNEKFYQRVVVPILDDQGRAVGLYGRDITGNSEVRHLYLAGAHRAVWNAEAARAYPDNLIVTESIFDALALWSAGQKNVIACYGVGGWAAHHDALIEAAGVRQIVFAFDADKAGGERAVSIAQKLDAKGLRCHRLTWPEGIHDACDYFAYQKQSGFRGSAESVAQLLQNAPRIGFSRDNDRFLSLIEGIAFLHQQQRSIGDDHGAEYIEASVADYAMAYDLAHQVFAQAGQDVAQPVADFLQRMEIAMQEAAKRAKQDAAHFFFSRRDVREALRLPDYLVKLYMRQIEELELIEVQRAVRGGSFRYRLAQRPEVRASLQGLTTPDELSRKWKSGTKVEVSQKRTQPLESQGMTRSGGSGTGKLAEKREPSLAGQQGETDSANALPAGRLSRGAAKESTPCVRSRTRIMKRSQRGPRGCAPSSAAKRA